MRRSTVRFAGQQGIESEPAEAVRATAEKFAAGISSWIPTPEDQAFVASVMNPVYEPGKVASWIAPPDRGINSMPVDYEYVRV